jgi:uncharacterized membrane protein YphA (DoxX/SURF4 family)
MKRILLHPRIAWVLAVVLGATFVAASYHKIVDPPDFAHMIYNYKLTPGALINLLAIYLPWVELVAGVALVLGLPGRRGAAALVAAMLVVFILAIGINLARGNAIDCGCFAGSTGPPKTRQERLDQMWLDIWRDVGLLVLVVQVLAANAVRRARAPAAARVVESRGSRVEG